jgi:hypothetical protein
MSAVKLWQRVCFLIMGLACFGVRCDAFGYVKGIQSDLLDVSRTLHLRDSSGQPVSQAVVFCGEGGVDFRGTTSAGGTLSLRDLDKKLVIASRSHRTAEFDCNFDAGCEVVLHKAKWLSISIGTPPISGDDGVYVEIHDLNGRLFRDPRSELRPARLELIGAPLVGERLVQRGAHASLALRFPSRQAGALCIPDLRDGNSLVVTVVDLLGTPLIGKSFVPYSLDAAHFCLLLPQPSLPTLRASISIVDERGVARANESFLVSRVPDSSQVDGAAIGVSIMTDASGFLLLPAVAPTTIRITSVSELSPRPGYATVVISPSLPATTVIVSRS